jgi:serine protease Do
VDERVPVEVLRDGKKMTLYVTLADRDVQLASQTEGGPEVGGEGSAGQLELLGIQVREMTREDRSDYSNEQGVLIEDIDPDSPAADKGLLPGDVIVEVNGQSVRTTGDFESAMKAAKDDGRPARLLVGRLQQNGQVITSYVAIRFEGDDKP